MKLKHSSLRSIQTLSSVGLITVSADGTADVTPEQAEHLLKCGFQLAEEVLVEPPPPEPSQPNTKDEFVAALDKASEPAQSEPASVEPKKKPKK